MNLPKRVNYLLLLFITTLALSFRAGYIYQHGADTWVGCMRILIISKEGAATWILHPLSYYGWYPFSYPTGQDFILSAVQQTTDQNIFYIAYEMSIFSGIFGIFSMYLLAKQIKNDDLFVFIVIFIFITFEWIIMVTWNNLSTRGLFIVLYPIIILFLLKAIIDGKHRLHFIVLVIISSIAILSIHRISILFIGVIFLPYFILLPINHSWEKFKIKIPKTNVTFILFSLIFFIFILQILDYTIIDFSESKIEEYQKHIFPGDNPFVKVLNLAGDYGVFYNISSIFAPIGLLSLIAINNKKFNERFLILISSISIFFILDITYFLYFFASITPILIGFGIIFLFKFIENNIKLLISICLICIIISTQFYIWYYEKGYYSLILISILGCIIIIWGLIKSYHFSSPKRVFAIILVGLFLIITPYASSISHYRSLDLMNDAESGKGKIFRESIQFNSGYWVREYVTSKWISDNHGLRNAITVISQSPSAMDVYYVADDEYIRESINTKFNISLIFNLEKSLYESEIEYRHHPRSVEYVILTQTLRYEYIIEKNHVGWIIFSWGNYNNEKFNVVFFLKEQRYPIYMDINNIVFHLRSFKSDI